MCVHMRDERWAKGLWGRLPPLLPRNLVVWLWVTNCNFSLIDKYGRVVKKGLDFLRFVTYSPSSPLRVPLAAWCTVARCPRSHLIFLLCALLPFYSSDLPTRLPTTNTRHHCFQALSVSTSVSLSMSLSLSRSLCGILPLTTACALHKQHFPSSQCPNRWDVLLTPV